MESQSLRTASTYVNNLLLSRGLLRNGISIEFASPIKAEGGLDGTMAQIMNLVHDLILRRDRESDALSNLSQTLYTMRTSYNQQNQTIARLETRNGDLERQLALTISQEKVAKASLRSAETRMKALGEETTRLKGTVVQIRSQCANDIRRRDVEIQKLKRHLEGRRGRDGTGAQIGMVVVTPGNKTQPDSRQLCTQIDLESPEYSLKQETTEFLTQLSQGLSDENDTLIGLVRSTLATLRSLQGLPTQGSEEPELPSNGSVAVVAPPTYEDLAASIDEVLEHLRGLLTNPSFVPLEEVEVREDEIIRLREGWERMETRWKEAVALMDGWRKRMVDTGDTIKLEDLHLGLNIGSEAPSVPPSGEFLGLEQETRYENDLSASSLEEEQGPNESPLKVDHISDLLRDELNTPFIDTKDPLCPTPPPNKIQPSKPITSKILSPRSPNIRPPISRNNTSYPSSPSHPSFPAIPEENTDQLLSFNQQIPIPWFSPLKQTSSPEKPFSHPPTSPLETPRTIAQKLASAEAEANLVRRRSENRPVGKSKPEKKMRGSRRRSTLSPEELERLIGGF